ncbi:alcohol dehydrogenase [Arthrobacter sp. RIT-PI-e]|uniref:quinone oxidoreductase family protein n=1 Tax=Arthrobacter sp. RIT-PI-e TaxID=1681197 RepID=UPI000675BCF7|nr:NADP-dependent oxidoreductase [Arthrobacter sp. RIT-PI-e]KNC20133.1 alcohol dehydrogenase [Arthrobacter sp. RIT-PI-e]
MSRAWVATDFGGFDVFQEVDVHVPEPRRGEVTLRVLAAGMNPADYKHVASGSGRELLPVRVGYEVAGVISAVGPGTEIASGGGAVGDEVLAFRISGGYAESVTVPARDVFAKPASLDFPQAANLLLAGTTAAEMLHVTGAGPGDAIVLHGASGAVGVSVLQQARLHGIRVIGTASEHNADVVREFGGEHVVYGEGLEGRLRELSPEGYAAALDAVGTDEAIDVSLALVPDRGRIVSIANFGRAERDGYRVIRGNMPDSAAFRDEARAGLIELAGSGDLVIPLARTYPLGEAVAAMTFLSDQHPGGKLALLP